MITISEFKKLALSFPSVVELPHFEKTSFRANKKIFATLDVKKHLATVILSTADQDVFCLFDKKVMFPVPNKWGKQGWTHIDLKSVPKRMFKDALQRAYCKVTLVKSNSLLK